MRINLPTNPGSWAVGVANVLLLVGGTVLLARQTVREWKQPVAHVAPWPAKGADFALWLCVVAFALATGGMLGAQVFHIGSGKDLTNFEALALGAAQQGAVLLAQLALLRFGGQLGPMPVNHGHMPWPKILRYGALAFVAAYPLIYLTGEIWQFGLDQLQHLLPKTDFPEQSVVQLIEQRPGSVELFLTLVVAGLVAPINEELLFRAGIYRFLKGKAPRWAALAATSALFALAHFNVLQFLPLFVLGWLLAQAYERTGQVGVPIVFHALFNFCTVIMLLVAT